MEKGGTRNRQNLVWRLGRNIRQHYALYIMILPVIAYYIIFHYGPMYGAQIAFRDYYPGMSFTEAKWVGLRFFTRFFSSYQFTRVIGNTLRLSLLGLVMGAPLPVLLAIMLNEVRSMRVKRVVQTVSYAPYFISVVAMCGMVLLFMSKAGFFNIARIAMGYDSIEFMAKPGYFPWIYVVSGIWQSCGFNSIIYMAALSGVDQELYEAAKIDGASKIKKILHIDLPMLLPTFMILLILNCGSLLSVGWEKALMLQNDLNVSASEIISTYTYKQGLLNAEYSYSAAIGFFNSAVNMVMLVSVNALSRKLSDTSLW